MRRDINFNAEGTTLRGCCFSISESPYSLGPNDPPPALECRRHWLQPFSAFTVRVPQGGQPWS
jgi:hypothetical protein